MRNQLQLYKINLCENKRTEDMTFSLLLNKPNPFCWSLVFEHNLLPDLSYSTARCSDWACTQPLLFFLNQSFGWPWRRLSNVPTFPNLSTGASAGNISLKAGHRLHRLASHKGLDVTVHPTQTLHLLKILQWSWTTKIIKSEICLWDIISIMSTLRYYTQYW